MDGWITQILGWILILVSHILYLAEKTVNVSVVAMEMVVFLVNWSMFRLSFIGFVCWIVGA